MLPTPHPAVRFQPVSEGAILLHTEHELYFGLNGVGAEVWQLLPPNCNSLDEICESLAGRYPEVSADDLCNDVAELLNSLAEQGLVVPHDAA